MYFVRTFKNGYQEHDPRRKRFAEYKCSNCGETEWVEIYWNSIVDTTRQIKCDHCNSYGKDDYLNNLISKKGELEKQKTKLEEEIVKLSKEIESQQLTPSGVNN